MLAADADLPLRRAAGATLGGAVYACNERLLAVHRSAQRGGGSDALASEAARREHVVEYGDDGRAFVRRGRRMSVLAALWIARGWLARELHYAVYRRQAADERAVIVSLAAHDGALARQAEQWADEARRARPALLYAELCDAPAASGSADSARRQRALEQLGVLGLADAGTVAALAARYRCMPASVSDALASSTLAFAVQRRGAHELARQLLVLQLLLVLQQSDSGGGGGWQAAQRVAAAARAPRVRSLGDVSDVVSARALAHRYAPLTEALLVAGALDLMQVGSVAQRVGKCAGPARRHARDWNVLAFCENGRWVCDPWAAGAADAQLTGAAFVRKLAVRIAQLGSALRIKAFDAAKALAETRDAARAATQQTRKVGKVKARAERKASTLLLRRLAAVVNKVLGVELIGAKGAVHADRLAYRAALLPAWAEAHGIDLPPAQRTWLAELGALWPDVRAAERARADGALHPLQHPAHDRAVVRSLSKWSPEEQCDESGDGDDSSDDDDTRAARRKRRRCTSSVAAAAAAAAADDDDESSESWTL